ncbi:MAG: NifU family protein [Spirochaetia bacterium]|nr:NifU family protein [Spirochaetia bacterium]
MSSPTETNHIVIESEWTPNPNALKFILNREVRPGDKVSFDSAEDAAAIPLAHDLFHLPYVRQVHFFENVITVSKDEDPDWEKAKPEIEDIIRRLIPHHDPFFVPVKPNRRASLSPELQKIEEILDRTIRPGLQGDGGDLEVVSLEGNKLSVHYQGACGSCPSSIGGTLQAIQGILQDEFNPDIQIEAL